MLCLIVASCQWSCRKVMFSVMCVCLLGGSHVTITCDALELTVQGTVPPSSEQGTSGTPWPQSKHPQGLNSPSMGPQGFPGPSPSTHWLHTLYMRPRRPPVPSASDIWWPSLETCSNLFTSAPPPAPAGLTYGDC